MVEDRVEKPSSAAKGLPGLKPIAPPSSTGGGPVSPHGSAVPGLRPAGPAAPVPVVKAPVANTAPAPVLPPVTSSMAGTSFRTAIGPAMLLPFRSNGPGWLIFAGLLSPFFYSQVARAISGSGFSTVRGLLGFMGAGLGMTLCARFFQVCAGASSHEYDQFPSPTSFGGLMDGYVWPGFAFSLFLSASFTPYWFISAFTSGTLGSVVTTVALVMPLVAWISALLLFAITDSKLAMFNFKAMWGVVSAYPKVTAGMVGAFVLATLAFVLVELLATKLGGFWLALVPAMIYIPWIHGFLGAMYGRVLVEYPRILEIAQEDDRDSRE
jgi:hypothetical protein